MAIGQSIRESIEVLKKAQDLDREIYRASRERLEIPALREKNKQELEQEKARLKELEAELKKIQLKQKEKEGELGQKEAQIKKLDGQLGQLKTNKEYAAMQQEIASLKADNSLLEEEIIKLIDAVDAADEEVKKEKERLKSVEKNFQEQEQQFTIKEKAALDLYENFKKQRDEIIHSIPPEISSLYDLIVQKKQGVALVKVKGEVCSACQIQLRPQLLNEIRLAQNVITCENCSRILYIEE